jgi:hypothetical protein
VAIGGPFTVANGSLFVSMYDSRARCRVTTHAIVNGPEVGDLALTTETIGVIEPDQPALFRRSTWSQRHQSNQSESNRCPRSHKLAVQDNSGSLDNRPPQSLFG